MAEEEKSLATAIGAVRTALENPLASRIETAKAGSVDEPGTAPAAPAEGSIRRRAEGTPTAQRQIVLASLVGTTIEFYDFYVYGTAAALVIGRTFFPTSEPGTQALNAFLTFGIAFLARPVGAIVFGHFGDRIGRKATLVTSMVVMGVSTTSIGLLPGYDTAGSLAPWLLCLLRFGQGIGFGGEWGGAALLATENATTGRRAWFGMFPQLGAPLGLFLANASFILLLHWFDAPAFLGWAWRLPFLVSAALVAIGLYLRVSMSETPPFQAALQRDGSVRVPLVEVLRRHPLPLLQGSLAIVGCYALFYVATVFLVGYAVQRRHVSSIDALSIVCAGAACMALATPVSAALADRFGRRPVLMVANALVALSTCLMPSMVGQDDPVSFGLFVCLEMVLMGLAFAPLGALLPELFPVRVRYTGSSTAYNLGGILGASLAPFAAQLLLDRGGLGAVSAYVAAAALLSLIAVASIRGDRPRFDL